MNQPLEPRASISRVYRWRRGLLAVSVVLFAVACVTPALVLHNYMSIFGTWAGYESIKGGTLLELGLLFGWTKFNFTAFANFPLWLSWILFALGRHDWSRKLSLAALVMSAETLQLVVQPYVVDEGGVKEGYLVAPHIGFICWIGSMIVIAWASQRLVRPNRIT
jgi:hypothetical protein